MQKLKPFQAISDLSLQANVKTEGSIIDISFILEDSKNLVKLESPVIKAERRQELWKDTCFELFFIVSYKTVNFKNHEIAGFTTLCNTI